jgi:NDP-sugar pyrophosphorylase family protein
MLDVHQRNGSSATIGVRPYVHEIPFGCVNLVGDRILDISEKPQLTRLVNAGIYVLEPRIIQQIEAGKCLQMPDLLAGMIDRGDLVGAYEISGDWIDVGRPSQLQSARQGDATPPTMLPIGPNIERTVERPFAKVA